MAILQNRAVVVSLLVTIRQTIKIKEFGWVGASRNNYLRTYQIVRDALLKGDEVWINVVDYDHKPKDQISSDQKMMNVGGGVFCNQCSTKFKIV